MMEVFNKDNYIVDFMLLMPNHISCYIIIALQYFFNLIFQRRCVSMGTMLQFIRKEIFMGDNFL